VPAEEPEHERDASLDTLPSGAHPRTPTAAGQRGTVTEAAADVAATSAYARQGTQNRAGFWSEEQARSVYEADRRHLPVGTVLGGIYRVRRHIGSGAMGSVFEVEHAALGKRFAAKVIRDSGLLSANSIRRLELEARAASAIDHENIVSVTHLGQLDDGSSFLVMELLQGEDLRDRLERAARLAAYEATPLPDDESREIVSQILRGLDAAHRAAIVHRDLKPENVFLSTRARGGMRVKIVDFGISKLHRMDDKGRLTGTGQILGTPMYMAPEQTRSSSRAIDGRADLYSLGVMAYEMTTGHVPFPGNDLFELLASQVNQEPIAPRVLRPELPETVEAVILKALAKDPEDRFRDAEAMLAAWERAWGVLPRSPEAPSISEATSVPPAPPPSSRTDRRKVALAVGLFALAAIVPVYELVRGLSEAPPDPVVEQPLGVAEGAAAAASALEAGRAPAGPIGDGPGDEPVPAGSPAENPAEPGAGTRDAPGIGGSRDPEGLGAEAAGDRAHPARGEGGGAQERAAPGLHTIRVASRPAGARILFRGQRVGTTPGEVEVPLDPDAPTILRLERSGYESATVELTHDGPAEVQVTLEPSAPPLVPR